MLAGDVLYGGKTRTGKALMPKKEFSLRKGEVLVGSSQDVARPYVFVEAWKENTTNILFISLFIRKFSYEQNRSTFFMPLVHKLYSIPM